MLIDQTANNTTLRPDIQRAIGNLPTEVQEIDMKCPFPNLNFTRRTHDANTT